MSIHANYTHFFPSRLCCLPRRAIKNCVKLFFTIARAITFFSSMIFSFFLFFFAMIDFGMKLPCIKAEDNKYKYKIESSFFHVVKNNSRSRFGTFSSVKFIHRHASGRVLCLISMQNWKNLMNSFHSENWQPSSGVNYESIIITLATISLWNSA